MITPPKPDPRLQQLEKFVETSITINSTTSLEELLQSIIKTATEILDCEAASILLHDEKRNRLFFAAASNMESRQMAQIPVPVDGSLAGTIFREEKATTLNNVKEDARHYNGVSQQINFEDTNLLGVPMRIRDKGVGVLEALNKRSGDFTPADEKLLSVLAAQAAVAIHNARLIQALQQAYENLSETDRLKSNFLALASRVKR